MINRHHGWLLLCASLTVVSGCRKKRNDANNANAGGPGGSTTSGPGGAAGTTTGAGEQPANSIGITGENRGESSVRSVPPTPATGCPAQLAPNAMGPGTVHNHAININETWTLEGSPHRFPDGIRINENVTVTIAPCAVVLVGSGNNFVVQDGGALMAVGDAQHPIRIGSDKAEPQPGDWSGLDFEAHARRSSRLAFVTVEHGGADSSTRPHAIKTSMQGLDLQHVLIRASRGFGVLVEESGTFSDTSVDLTVREGVVGGANGAAAVAFMNPDAVRTLPQGTYTGNEINEVFVEANTSIPVKTTATWRNPGVRYHFADEADLRIEGPTSPILTIAPGTTLAFGSGASIAVGWDTEGGLIADGGSEAGRITFTASAADPNPGGWEGVFIGARASRTRTKLSWLTIAYAAGDSGTDDSCAPSESENDAALYLRSPLPAESLSHLKFTGMPENSVAISRGWEGTTAVSYVAPALANDFAGSGTRCRQTVLRTNGSCPETPTCE